MNAVPATFARTPTLRALEQLLSDELSLDVVGLDPESTLDELGIDSLALIECMFKIEDRFDISVANGETNVRSLSDIAALVDRLVREKAAAEKEDEALSGA